MVEFFAMKFQLQVFISPFPDPMAIATEVFLFDWSQELYTFPETAILYFARA